MIVIAILGILAVTALPKFINLQTDAQQAVNSAIVASIESAVSMTYSKAIIKNQVGSIGALNITGIAKPVQLIYGYPKAQPTDLNNNSSIIDLIDVEGITSDNPNKLTITYGSCVITYTDSSGPGIKPVIAKENNC